MEKLYKYVKIILVLLMAAAIAVLISNLPRVTAADIVQYTPRSIPLAILVLISVYLMKTIVFVIPLIILFISTGIIFPPGLAIAVTYLCLFFESSFGYLIGRLTGKKMAARLMRRNPKAERILKSANRNTSCLLSRILPLPYDVISMFWGASGAPYWKYVCLSLLGVSPTMIPYVIAGSAIDNPLSPAFLVPFALSILVPLAAFIYMQILSRRKSAK